MDLTLALGKILQLTGLACLGSVTSGKNFNGYILNFGKKLRQSGLSKQPVKEKEN